MSSVQFICTVRHSTSDVAAPPGTKRFNGKLTAVALFVAKVASELLILTKCFYFFQSWRNGFHTFRKCGATTERGGLGERERGCSLFIICTGKSLVYSLNRLRTTKVDPAELAGRCCRQYFSCTNL